MTIENRQEVVEALRARVLENAPLRELVRVYSEAVEAAVSQLDDDGVINAITQSGYLDILEAFGLSHPEATQTPSQEPAAV